ncbi:MAG: metalloprotease RseP [Deltaproteobacteria bacterium]|nr:metalloprotease RseP [Deltaproteobacteria bacterium]
MDRALDGLVWYVVFLFSTSLHEAAHAWAAQRGGDPTAYLGGQLSLDPRPHIRREPFGMLMLPLFTAVTSGWPIGYASAPYDPVWAANHPRRAAWMSLAGPAANLLLVLAASATIWLGIAAGVFAVPDTVSGSSIVAPVSEGLAAAAALLVSAFFTLNLILCLFNLMPLPPLDGAGAVGVFLSDAAARRFQELTRHPMLAIAGIVIAWNVFGPIFRRAFWIAVGLLYPGSGFG